MNIAFSAITALTAAEVDVDTLSRLVASFCHIVRASGSECSQLEMRHEMQTPMKDEAFTGISYSKFSDLASLLMNRTRNRLKAISFPYVLDVLFFFQEGDLPAPASTEPLDPSLIPSGRPGTSAGFTLEKVLEKEGSSDEPSAGNVIYQVVQDISKMVPPEPDVAAALSPTEQGWGVRVEPDAPMSMNQRSLFMVRKSKNGTAIACPIIRAELLSFVSMGQARRASLDRQLTSKPSTLMSLHRFSLSRIDRTRVSNEHPMGQP
ncbi:hypothetical protein Q3G72_006226 [Acer saccharum]|nr:hypothetical protein Q3G72_020713 [Acer saccharum]KAK1566927.1 hypothetical protein Q3G72_006226 [Acer saccharum]